MQAPSGGVPHRFLHLRSAEFKLYWLLCKISIAASATFSVQSASAFLLLQFVKISAISVKRSPSLPFVPLPSSIQVRVTQSSRKMAPGLLHFILFRMKKTAKLTFWGLTFAVAALLQPAAAEPVFQLISEIFPQPTDYFYSSTILAEAPDGSLYGTTGTPANFGYGNKGTVFRITPDGIFTTVFTFNGTNGTDPEGGVTFGSDGNLYGTTSGNFAPTFSDNGTVFRLTTNGDLTTLVTFGSALGGGPLGPLLKSRDGFFYGTTSGLHASGFSTVFKMDEAGNLTTLHSFNTDEGTHIQSRLVQGGDGTLYGTALWGGIFNDPPNLGNGTIFKLTSNGTFTVLFRFDGPNGRYPFGGLCFGPDGDLYGTADSGGAFDQGTIFKITTNGIFTALFSFDGTNGARPEGPLTLGPDGWFYGTTAFHSLFSDKYGTNWSYGTVYRVNTNSQVHVLASLNGTNARNPIGAVVLCRDGNLYGLLTDWMKKTTLDGNMGAIFRLVEPPTLTAAPATNGFLLSWNSFKHATYQIDYSPWLSNAPWTTITDSILSTDTNTLFLVPEPVPQGTYRVTLKP
jgi:uncharacterized repeat protein (TIGR03803 family)